MNGAEILVAGGGIGGLAAALGLARRGKRVRLLEKAAEFGEIGAGIQLAPNASRALDDLGVLEAIRPSAVFPQRIVWMDAQTGEQLTAFDLGDAFRARYGYPYLVMHRSDLLAALLDACEAHPGIVLETSKSIIAAENHGDGASVRCADGSTYEGAALIGADGLWSTIRKTVVGDGDPICSAYVAYRGAIPIEEVSSHARLEAVMLWTGPDMHLVQYPLRRGELYNQVAVFKSDRYAAGAKAWGTPDELDARFAGATDLVTAALGKIRRNRRWPMYDRLPNERWTNGRVTLLGDAAHPMLQYLAQGAAQAIEDAVVLAGAVAAHDDLDAGIAAYEAERAPRTARVQTLARTWGDYWHQHDHTQRDVLLRARSADDYTESDWFYGYRPPAFA